MATLQEEQPPFDRAVCNALLASTPDDWTIIIPSLKRPEGESRVGQLRHSIFRATHGGLLTPDDLLYQATYRLDDLFQRRVLGRGIRNLVAVHCELRVR
jgi:hypothetical protein